jgi:hypothetical protein
MSEYTQVTDKLPRYNGWYIVVEDDGKRYIAWYSTSKNAWRAKERIINPVMWKDYQPSIIS